MNVNLNGTIMPSLGVPLDEVMVNGDPKVAIRTQGTPDEARSRISELSRWGWSAAQALALTKTGLAISPRTVAISTHAESAHLIVDRQGASISVRGDWLDRACLECAVRSPGGHIPPVPVASCAVAASLAVTLLDVPADVDPTGIFLAALLVAADEAAVDVVGALRTDCPWLSPGSLLHATAIAYAAALADPRLGRANRADRRAGGPVTSAFFLPALQEAASLAGSRPTADRIALAHHRIGKALVTTDHRAVAHVRRSTYRGRYRHLDVLLADILGAALACRAGALAAERVHGVDVAALAASLPEDGSLRICDEAVSDATTTLDLKDAIARLGTPAEISAGDVNMRFGLVAAGEVLGVVDASGSCVQTCGPHVPGWPWRALPAADDKDAARAVAEAAASEPAAVAWLRWLHPAASGEPRPGDQVGLSFSQRDLFEPRPPWANAVRAMGVLYRRQRDDADAASYFDDATVLAGVRALGTSLLPGGVALIGSVIDSVDGLRTYTDADFVQRSESSAVLRHVARLGLGLGPALDGSAIPL